MRPPALPPRVTQQFVVEFTSHVPLRKSEERILNLALQRAVGQASLESPLRDARFAYGKFSPAEIIKPVQFGKGDSQ